MSQDERTTPDASEFAGNEIAIVGMAAHLPGATDAEQFWRNLRDGVESVRQFSVEELRAAGVDAELLRNPRYVPFGVELADMEMFDAEFFGFSPKEAAIMDPQHRHFLECAWEALENAGHTPGRFDGPIGVFGGCGMGAYFAFNLLNNPQLRESVGLFLLRHTGNDKDFLATRVSYCFNLTGPSVNVQTACSTSLVAVHMASQSLLAGECDMALAGGVTIEIPHRQGYLYQEGEILSPDGHCRAFDHRSEGTIFGSGAGVVVLRRLADAIADGDHIYAVIKGSAVNNDGASKVGYLAPSVDGQAGAMAEALAVAGVDADTIGMVECHGTGTRMGDPIEVAALTQAYRGSTKRNGFVGIGSVKSNIGHLDTAAGVASLMKAALAVQHGQIPPTLGYEAPNPQIDFDTTPFYVNAELREWPHTAHPRRAAVNSLGVGGTNAHAILEQAPRGEASGPATHEYQLLTLSARNRAALDAASQRLAAHLREHPEQPLADVAWTLALGRRAFEQRRVVAARSHAEAIALLESSDAQRVFTHKAIEDKKSVAFMFPGGGVQYFGMGRELYAAEAEFRRHVDRGLDLLRPMVDFDLRDLLFADESRSAEVDAIMERPAVQLPAIFMIEYALAQLWMRWGVQPDALIGHSLGENTAACVAGVLSFEEALGLVKLRGELFERLPEGGMISVGLPADELLPLLGDDLDLATVNSPAFCTASGPAAALDRLERELSARGVEAKRIPIKIAAHSRMLEPILTEFGDYLRKCRLSAPKIPFVSNRTGTWITDREATDPEYWVAHLRHTIHFADGIGTLLATPGRVMIEVGPGKALSSLARQHPLMQPGQLILSSLRHAQEKIDDAAFFATAFGRLWAAGVSIPIERYWQGERRRRVPLPAYAFQRQRYWIDATATAAQPADKLQRLAKIDDWFYTPAWREEAAASLSDEALREALATHRDQSDSSAPQTTSEPWLVFADDAGVGQLVVERLRRAGQEVIVVREGDAFARIGEQEYRLAPEQGRDGYVQLLRELTAHGQTPARIVHAWLVTADESFRPGSSFFHRNQERGFYSLLFLSQAMAGEGWTGERRLTVIGNGIVAPGDEQAAYPDKATVLGPVKVLPREFAGLTCSLVDVATPMGARGKLLRQWQSQVAEQIIGELARAVHSTGDNASEIVALRQERRLVEVYERARVSGGSGLTSKALRERGVYLITGGLGGIGLTVAEYLARKVTARLVLVSRSGLPSRSMWDGYLASHAESDPTAQQIRSVQALEASGADVIVAAADVTDAEALGEAIAAAKARFGAIHGVFHAAGVLRDGLAQTKTQSQVEDVFGPKVHGTLVLAQCLADEPLDFFAAFSSTSSVTAPAGQIDYVAASAFLNQFCRANSGRGPRGRWKRAVALGWGVWNEVGMAVGALRRMEGSSAPAAPPEQPVAHPWFEHRVGGLHDRQCVLHSQLSTAGHWVLDEHRTTRGDALLPGTAYIELARAALAELGAEGRIEISDLFFVRPLQVDDDELRPMRVRLASEAGGYRFEVQSQMKSADGRIGWATHAQAQITREQFASSRDGLVLPESRLIDLTSIDARCQTYRAAGDHSELRTKQETFLQFGPRWQVLRSVAFGSGEALAHLEMPARYVGDFEHYGLHPALVDLATGFAMRLIAGHEASSALWAPVSYRRVRVFGMLPPRIVSHVRAREGNHADGRFAAFDVTIADEAGNVLVEIEEFSMTRIAEGVQFAKATAPLAGELEFDPNQSVHTGRKSSPAEKRFAQQVALGITPREGMAALDRVLAEPRLNHVIVSSLDLHALRDEAGRPATAEQGEARFARPTLDNDYAEPRDDIERTIVGFFQELLGVDRVGVKDSFFELGGHSLVAVRLFAKIKQAYHAEFPISVLFEAPTVEACAALVKQQVGDAASSSKGEGINTSRASSASPRRHLHLVPMHEGDATAKTPFFLVAGMFGNVLNLRHLAHLVGADRPCYGLQARGLFGDTKPHETFVEAAADYLAEIRSVQPHGPYLLGGFSGGGITAYEMAQQLRAAGEEVALLVLLDTPLPFDAPLSLRDKLVMHGQKIARQKHRYFTDRVRSRIAWEIERRKQRREQQAERSRVEAQESPATVGEQHAAAFQSALMENAFRVALGRYALKSYPGKVTLLRPKLHPEHVLGGGRMINKDRRFIYADNGWTEHVGELEVVEVPGDHDSMVLEPNVRTLAARLRRAIERAEMAALGQRRFSGEATSTLNYAEMKKRS